MTTQQSSSTPESTPQFIPVVQAASELPDLPNPDDSPTQTERPLSEAQIAAAEPEATEGNQMRNLITPEMIQAALLSDGSAQTDRSPTQTERGLTPEEIEQILKNQSA